VRKKERKKEREPGAEEHLVSIKGKKEVFIEKNMVIVYL
jgi:hypothetical protein